MAQDQRGDQTPDTSNASETELRASKVDDPREQPSREVTSCEYRIDRAVPGQVRSDGRQSSVFRPESPNREDA